MGSYINLSGPSSYIELTARTMSNESLEEELRKESQHLVPKPNLQDPQPELPPRQIHVEVIMIFLPYLVYLWHLSVVYFPRNEVPYYTKYPGLEKLRNETRVEDPISGVSLDYLVQWLNGFCHTWLFPAFFFFYGT